MSSLRRWIQHILRETYQLTFGDLVVGATQHVAICRTDAHILVGLVHRALSPVSRATHTLGLAHYKGGNIMRMY